MYLFFSSQIERNALNETERYFVRMDSADLLRFRNVEMLETDHYFKWVEKMDREVLRPFDMLRGPLWRLCVVKISNNSYHNNHNHQHHPQTVASNAADYNCVFILSTQNTLGDEHNMFELFEQLLNLVNALLEGRRCAEMDNNATSAEDDDDDVRKQTKPQAITGPLVRSGSTVVDAGPYQTRRFRIKREVNLRVKRSSGLFETDKRRGGSSLNMRRFSSMLAADQAIVCDPHGGGGSQQHLREFNVKVSGFDSKNRVSSTLANKYDDSCGRFKHFFLDSTRLRNLVVCARLNTNNANLTSVLSTIVCLAFKNLFFKYQVSGVRRQNACAC